MVDDSIFPLLHPKPVEEPSVSTEVKVNLSFSLSVHFLLLLEILLA